MQKLLTTLIVILALAVLLVFVAALFGSYTLIFNHPSNDLNISQRLSLLPAITVSAGVLVAILTFERERKKQELERQRHVSEVFLERVKDGFKTVIDLLSDQNNNRITWVRAARTLLKSLELKEQIEPKEYKVAYELEEERARNELYTILSLVDKESGERVPLPPQFFYGIEDWRTCNSLDDAAIKASSSAVVYSPTIDEVPPQPNLKHLLPKSVIAIFDFVEYPKTYNDPLKSVGDWDVNWEDSYAIDQGVRRYVAHTKEKIAIGGKLHDLNKNKSG
ncbi:MAG: hypothetical protein PHG00_09050 [Methylococcales bacterium]|nr:hypothetical protein [Methylococcales bacterium]